MAYEKYVGRSLPPRKIPKEYLSDIVGVMSGGGWWDHLKEVGQALSKLFNETPPVLQFGVNDHGEVKPACEAIHCPLNT